MIYHFYFLLFSVIWTLPVVSSNIVIVAHCVLYIYFKAKFANRHLVNRIWCLFMFNGIHIFFQINPHHMLVYFICFKSFNILVFPDGIFRRNFEISNNRESSFRFFTMGGVPSDECLCVPTLGCFNKHSFIILTSFAGEPVSVIILCNMFCSRVLDFLQLTP